MKALVIDDERWARAHLIRLLGNHPQIEIVGQAANGTEAKAAIDAQTPDLLFLDIQMPGETGFQLLERLNPVPLVVFTTAYDEFALKSFQFNTVDYLVKPIDPDRLATTVRKILQFQEEFSGNDEAKKTRLGPVDQIFVKDGRQCWFVRLQEVRLFESEGNYCRLYFGSQKPLIYKSLNALEKRLDPKVFFRANRKHVFNLAWVSSLDPGHKGALVAVLKCGARVEMSRRRAQTFKEQLSL